MYFHLCRGAGINEKEQGNSLSHRGEKGENIG